MMPRRALRAMMALAALALLLALGRADARFSRRGGRRTVRFFIFLELLSLSPP
jgi:hypothetical protein